ncbi:ribonuclease H-like domain-containing protein [Pholiota molesta]|nr:ribonuclease H-like domain-containing protein [Pholiota molesta]
MFTTAGLFKDLACPARDTCTRPQCIYSHLSNIPPPKPLGKPAFTSPQSASGSSSGLARATANDSVIPAKRPAIVSPSKLIPVSAEPPRKVQKVNPGKRIPVPTASHTESGVPILRVNAAQSQVPIPVRQTMLQSLYNQFVILYECLLPSNPSLASAHALKQEQEIYAKSTKLTYRNAVIQCIAALRRRSIPTSPSHLSVGTEADIAARVEAQENLDSLRLSGDLLAALIHPVTELQKWGYIVETPSGSGGEEPAIEGKIAKCERCPQYFLVKRLEDTDQCIYHWGKPSTTRANGEKVRIYTCCSRPVADGEGCSHGPHVFYESKAEELHSRHGFSFLSNHEPGRNLLDVAALDCEMVYTTGGLRVARVSVVDGSGKEVFDELVRMDEGVNIIDYNTRFSGITPEKYATAQLTLAAVRKALDLLIDTNTILIGHALDNDLKTLRIIHHKCIDTALLFPHRAGLPYRRSLKDLVREKLGKMIQIGDATEGHSSVEDASATLDLVRWYILNKQKSAVQ